MKWINSFLPYTIIKTDAQQLIYCLFLRRMILQKAAMHNFWIGLAHRYCWINKNELSNKWNIDKFFYNRSTYFCLCLLLLHNPGRAIYKKRTCLFVQRFLLLKENVWLFQLMKKSKKILYDDLSSKNFIWSNNMIKMLYHFVNRKTFEKSDLSLIKLFDNL